MNMPCVLKIKTKKHKKRIFACIIFFAYIYLTLFNYFTFNTDLLFIHLVNK